MKKHCNHCLLTKPLSAFHRDKKNKDGYCSRCAACKNKANRVKYPFKTYNGKPLDISSYKVIKVGGGMFDDMKLTNSERRRLDALHNKTKIQREEFCIQQEKDVYKVNISQEITDQLDDLYGVHDIKSFERVIDSLYKAQDRFFTFEVSSNKVILKYHGSPSITLKGTIQEVLSQALL